MSIFSICATSRRFDHIHKSEVILATYPGHKGYKKNDLFKNVETIRSFDEVIKKGAPDFLQLHIPEYASQEVYDGLEQYSDYLQSIQDLRINIMNQNIEAMPNPAVIARWFALTSHVTQTTAHDRYCTQELADTYNIPTHHLSTFVDKNSYKVVPFEEKQNIIAVSSDETAKKEAILQKIRDSLPAYEIITVQNMKFEDYKKLIREARFTITFGEGFDGYYVEPFLSGGITFAVYNDKFFPDEEFRGFDNVFSSYDDMLAEITNRIKKIEDKAAYKNLVTKNAKKINTLYSFDQYVQNIKQFYQGKFTFVPTKDADRNLLKSIVIEYEEQISRFQKEIDEKDSILAEKERLILEKDQAMDKILASISWKVTLPLRKVSSKVRKSRSS